MSGVSGKTLAQVVTIAEVDDPDIVLWTFLSEAPLLPLLEMGRRKKKHVKNALRIEKKIQIKT